VRQLALLNLAAGKSADELRAILLKDEHVARITRVLQLFQGAYHAYDEIQLAESDTGVILASSDERHLGQRIDRTLFPSDESASPDRVSIKVRTDAHTDHTQLIIARSILDTTPEHAGKGKPLAVGILRIQTDGFIKPMLYTGEGLGRSGEIVLADQEARNLISLKFPLPDGSRPRPLEYEINTEPMRLAIQKQQGIVTAKDYRGVPVLAAYRHIHVAAGTDWGMVVKVDESEVLGPLWKHATCSLLTGLIGLAAIMALAAFSAHRILKPIRSLSQTAVEVERGNFDVRAPVERADEIGALTATFNSMVDRIRNWHTELEEQVTDRTARLNQLNGELVAEINERTRAERALAAERQRLEVTLRSIGDGVVTTDTAGLVVSLNSVGETLTGWKEADAVTRPIQEVFHIVNESSRARCVDPVQKALNTGQIVDLANDTILIARDGTERILADTCAPVRDGDGKVYGAVLVFRDVTAAKKDEKALIESEERFRQLADNVQDVFWLTESGNPTRIAYLNAAHETLWGFPREDAYRDPATRVRCIHEEDRERVGSAYDLFLDSRGDYDVEYRIVRPDGSTRWIWDRAFAVRDDKGTVFRVAGLAQDITRRKLDEQKQEQLIEEIKHFAYIVSHDLRAPLSNLKGFNSELRRSVDEMKPLARKGMRSLTEQERQALSTVLEHDIPEAMAFMDASASRMGHLIGAILNLSRLGHRELELTRVNMDELVAETLRAMAHQMNQRVMEVKVHPLPEIVADRTSVEQIFSNLLSNALNYLDPGRPGLVEIWCSRLGTDAAFHVRDNGVGIEPENRQKIFEIFQRIRKLDVPGEGMGLACVRTLVRRHGGRVWCESEPGVGSTFTFTMPVQIPGV
jgi:PAS domain S-box-containing protein